MCVPKQSDGGWLLTEIHLGWGEEEKVLGSKWKGNGALMKLKEVEMICAKTVVKASTDEWLIGIT